MFAVSKMAHDVIAHFTHTISSVFRKPPVQKGFYQVSRTTPRNIRSIFEKWTQQSQNFWEEAAQVTLAKNEFVKMRPHAAQCRFFDGVFREGFPGPQHAIYERLYRQRRENSRNLRKTAAAKLTVWATKSYWRTVPVRVTRRGKAKKCGVIWKKSCLANEAAVFSGFFLDDSSPVAFTIIPVDVWDHQVQYLLI